MPVHRFTEFRVNTRYLYLHTIVYTYYMDTKAFKKTISEGIPAHLPEMPAYDKNINHAPNRKDILNIEEKQRQLQGHDLVLLTNKVPLYDKYGDISGVLGIYIDITKIY